MADTGASATERRFTMPRRDAIAQGRNTGGTAATSSPLIDLGDASPKRASTHLGDLQTPYPSSKRVKREARSPSGTLESLNSIAQPTAPIAGASTRPQSATTAQHTEGAHAAASPRTSLPIKSATYWYPDGNVVIKGDATYYKLHSSRLARYCIYFKKLFADDANEYEDRCEKIDGCPIYHIPADLDLGDFEKLLIVLETPLIYTDAPPTQAIALSLVRAAHSLSCDVVLKLARKHLCAIWDAENPPKASPHPTTKTNPAPSSLSADTTAVHTYHDALFIILFARQYGIPELLKRAFYELLASAEFWATLTADRKQIRLTEADLLRLYNARHVLQQRWREAVVLAPYMDEKGVSTCRGNGSACSIYNHLYSSRSQHWRKMMLESEVVEAGMGDPLRYDASSGLTKEQKETWCRGCRKGWTDMLAVKRREWWASFGELMQLA
ncbi:hypothetical protein VTO73DRAFT_15085 [Trametes versicolor]